MKQRAFDVLLRMYTPFRVVQSFFLNIQFFWNDIFSLFFSSSYSPSVFFVLSSSWQKQKSICTDFLSSRCLLWNAFVADGNQSQQLLFVPAMPHQCCPSFTPFLSLSPLLPANIFKNVMIAPVVAAVARCLCVFV